MIITTYSCSCIRGFCQQRRPEKNSRDSYDYGLSKNRDQFEIRRKEAIHLILTGIGDEIYSTVDACQAAQEMWEAIEILQQGESLNIQDVKTNLFWEFGQFTSHDGETIESYYTRFYKMMNEMIKNNLTVATMLVYVQFLQQLQPEWSRFSEDKDMHKNLALIAKYFKKIYKPTNNNLRTSSNTRNKNVDTTPRYKNDNQSGQFGNQRAVNVVGARETVGGPVGSDTDEEIDEQELEAHYSYMAKIQEVPNADSGTDSEPLEQDDQNDVECDDERVALANLIANLKLDVNEIKKIQKQYRKHMQQ
ncbi:hypothetical protein Tco_1561261 [Tanacetum coccineum]